MLENEIEALKVHQLKWQKPKSSSGSYESEVKAIQARRGDLEAIRQNLGLSKKRISELLLVDPSAWTRWTTGVSRVPAHIYQSLDWYLKLSEKDPQIHANVNIQRMEKELSSQREHFQARLEDLKTNFKSEQQSEAWQKEKKILVTQLESAEKISFIWKALLVATFILALL